MLARKLVLLPQAAFPCSRALPVRSLDLGEADARRPAALQRDDGERCIAAAELARTARPQGPRTTFGRRGDVERGNARYAALRVMSTRVPDRSLIPAKLDSGSRAIHEAVIRLAQRAAHGTLRSPAARGSPSGVKSYPPRNFTPPPRIPGFSGRRTAGGWRSCTEKCKIST